MNDHYDDTRRIPSDVTRVGSLVERITELSDALRAARLDAANLRAAIGAVLGADADGEADPLVYLRDEYRDALGEWCL